MSDMIWAVSLRGTPAWGMDDSLGTILIVWVRESEPLAASVLGMKMVMSTWIGKNTFRRKYSFWKPKDRAQLGFSLLCSSLKWLWHTTPGAWCLGWDVLDNHVLSCLLTEGQLFINKKSTFYELKKNLPVYKYFLPICFYNLVQHYVKS